MARFWNFIKNKLGITELNASINNLSSSIINLNASIYEIDERCKTTPTLLESQKTILNLIANLNSQSSEIKIKILDNNILLKDLLTLYDNLIENHKETKEELNNIKTNMLEFINSNLIILNDVAEEIKSINEKQSLTLTSIGSNTSDLKNNIKESTEVLKNKIDTLITNYKSQITVFKELNSSLDKELKEIKELAKIPGPPGKDGKNGKDGKKGNKGRDGKNGRNGLDGKDGLTIIGPKGDKGKDGISIQGPKGDKGDKGDSIVGPKGDKGDSITGPKGDKGDKGDSIVGPKGDKGDPGKDGLQCNNGEKGEKGEDGITTTIIKTELIPEQLIEKKIEEAIKKIKLPTIEIPEDLIDKKIKEAIDIHKNSLSNDSGRLVSEEKNFYNLEVLDKKLLRAIITNTIPNVYNVSDINTIPSTYEIHIGKFKQIGLGMRNNHCYDNALLYSKQYNEQLYVGIIIKKDDVLKVMNKEKITLNVYNHAWCITPNGLLADYTLGDKLSKDYIYVGRYIINTLSSIDIEKQLREETIIL